MFALVLALVPLQNCPIDIEISHWKCLLQNENGLTLSNRTFQACWLWLVRWMLVLSLIGHTVVGVTLTCKGSTVVIGYLWTPVGPLWLGTGIFVLTVIGQVCEVWFLLVERPSGLIWDCFIVSTLVVIGWIICNLFFVIGQMTTNGFLPLLKRSQDCYGGIRSHVRVIVEQGTIS